MVESYPKDCRKKCVLSFFLKISTDGAYFMSIGMEFHAIGADTLKLRLPIISRERKTVKHLLSADLRLLVKGMDDTTKMNSDKYTGARLCSALKTKRLILNSIRCSTRSQCSLLSRGVIWSRLVPPYKSLAAAFSTDFNRSHCR